MSDKLSLSIMEKFIIIKDSIKAVRRYKLTGRVMDFKIKPVPQDVEPVGWIKDAINQVVQRATEHLEPSDYVGFSFCSKEFSRGEGWIRFRPVNEINYEDVWDIISSIYQSNSSGFNTESFCLGVTSVQLPSGQGRGSKYNTFKEECGMRRGIITIKNSDNLCLPRALIVAIAHLNKDPEFNKVRRDIGKIQTIKTLELFNASGISISEDGAGIPELQQFQDYLKDYKIVVYSYGTKGRDVIFEGDNDCNRRLNLLHHDKHYNVITSLTAAFCCDYYCEECKVPYDHKNKHRCGGTCSSCQQSPRCVDQVKIKCDDCKRYFKGQTCFENHIKEGSREKSTVCIEIKCCENCFKTVKGSRKHICGEIFCKNCSIHVPENHLCYIQRDTGKPKTKDTLFVFYDLETQQDTKLEDGSFLHKASLCVFKQCCDVCIDTNTIVCQKCGVRLQKIKGSGSIAKFISYLLNSRKLFKQIIVIAHNGQAFDHQFILNYILTQTDLSPELIMRGSKILLMQVGNVKFIDSLNYFPMGLSKLPKAFGLGDKFKKGYFPHLFNKLENENYIGLLPAIEYYNPDEMKEMTVTNF